MRIDLFNTAASQISSEQSSQQVSAQNAANIGPAGWRRSGDAYVGFGLDRFARQHRPQFARGAAGHGG